MKLLNIFKSFKNDEAGAVTVDWVVLTAAIVGLGLVVMQTVRRRDHDRCGHRRRLDIAGSTSAAAASDAVIRLALWILIRHVSLRARPLFARMRRSVKLDDAPGNVLSSELHIAELRFLPEVNSATVTVDWVVLTAAIVGLPS